MPWALRMITFAGLLIVLLLIYTGFRYFRSIRILDLQPVLLYRAIFFILAAMFLAFPLAGHLEYWTHNSFNRTAYPGFIVYPFWYGLVFTGAMLNWLLLHDLLKPLVLRFSRKDNLKLTSWFAGAFLVLALLTALYTAGKMAWDTRRIAVDHISYELPGGISLSGPLTIVHIADLHADQYTGAKKMERYVRKINQAKPDVVVFAGDLISSGLDHVEAGADALAGIRSTYGTWFVMGDHDYWSGTDYIAEAVEARGIHVLQNENAVISHRDMPIKITGVTELYSEQIEIAKLETLLEEAAGEGLHLLLSHQATDRLIDAAVDSGVHQILAGHTHGGQIRVRLFFYPLTAVLAETPYVKGSWLKGHTLLNINSGLGFTLSPVRYNAPAQVTVIHVK